MNCFLKIFTCIVFLLPIHLMAQYVVNGVVVDKNTNETLTGAHVSIESTSQQTVTDKSGFFTFSSLKSGDYLLKTSFMGYEEVTTLVHVNSDVESLRIALQPRFFMTDEVVVKASRSNEKTPITYTEVDAALLRKTNKGADLPYLLQQTPSLVVTSDAGSGVGYTALRIRGSDLTRINVTLNGVPVNDAESHSVYFVDLPDMASSIDNIQIQRGVGTSSNGAAAFGASINIKTDETDTEPYAYLSSATGSFNTFKNTLGFSTGRAKNGFSLTGRLSKVTSDGYIDRGSSDLGSYYLSGAWYGKKTLVKLIATSGIQETYQSWNGIPKDSLNTNRTYNPSGEMYDSDGNIVGYYANEVDKYQQDYYQLHIAHEFSKSLTLTATTFLTNGKGYYENWKNNDKLSKYGLPNVVIGDETISRTDLVRQKWLDNSFYGAHLALDHKKGRFNTTFGGGMNRYEGKHFGKIIWAKYPSTSNNEWHWYDSDGTKTEMNVFAKTSVELTHYLNFFVDLQYRHIDYEIAGIHDDLRDITQDHLFDFFNPKAGLFFTINDRNSLYFSVSRSNREPNRSVYRDADPNQKITFESLIDYELGYSLKTKSLMFNTNVFYMDYTDQLVLTGKINNVGDAIMINVEDSYRLGIENGLTWQLCKKIRLGANLSVSANKIENFTEYIDNWNFDGEPENGPYQYENELGTTDISFSPAVIGGYSLSYFPLKGLEFNLNGNYVSRQYLDNTSNKYRSIDPYCVNNIMLNYEWKQPIFRSLTFSLSLNNILSEEYESNGWVYRYVYDDVEYLQDGYFPQAKFNFMFGVTIGI